MRIVITVIFRYAAEDFIQRTDRFSLRFVHFVLITHFYSSGVVRRSHAAAQRQRCGGRRSGAAAAALPPRPPPIVPPPLRLVLLCIGKFMI